MDATVYDVPVDPLAPNNVHAMTLRLVGHNKRILEFGCASGHMTRAFVSQGNQVVAIEIDPEAAQRAAKSAERVIVGDLETMDLAAILGENTFDVVTFGDVLEHLRDPHSVLKAARRFLRPDGFAVISLPNVAHADVRLALVEGRWDYQPFGLMDNTHIRFFTRDSCRKLVREAGFHVAVLDRVIRPAFSTELGVVRERFPEDVIDQILRDPDAETYQFVFKAVLDNGDHAATEAFDRLAALEDERLHVPVQLALAEADRVRAAVEVRQAQNDIDELRQSNEALEARLLDVQRSIQPDDSVVLVDVEHLAELEAQSARLAALRANPVARVLRRCRRLVARRGPTAS